MRHAPTAAVLLLLAGACRTASPRPSTAPTTSTSTAPVSTSTGPARQTSPAGASAANGTGSTSGVRPDSVRRDSVASADELARTVTAVFGAGVPVKDRSDVVPDSLIDPEPAWDIDVRSYETHERVAHYVQLFSGSARDRFMSRLGRGTKYEPMIRAKLRAGGLPEDMTYLALIESGYDPHAYSKAAAVGMWQFMSGTARDVGMRVDWWVDERRDPARSTDGAIRFLTDLQKQFGGSLYLAAAAYNGGPGRVARGLTRFAEEMGASAGEDRFFALAEQDYLRAETKNYVPQLIAAALVAKMPGRYGVAVDSEPAYAYDSLEVEPGTSLAAVSAAGGATVAELRDLNPALLRGMSPPDKSYWVKVPSGSAGRTVEGLAAMPASSKKAFRTQVVTGTKSTIASLASSAGVTARQIGWYNPGLKTTRKGRLVAGQTVRIPATDALAFAREIPDPSIERYGTSATRTLSSGGYHVVKRGESLGVVAKRYGLSVARLKSLNGIKGTRLVAGQTLRVRSTVSAKKSATARKSTAKKSAVKTATKSGASTRTSGKKSVAKAPVKKSTKPPVKKTTAKKPAR